MTDHAASARFIGGNSVDRAASSPVRDFCRLNDGHTVITKVLIANNGIAAVKEIRSVRKWAYETFGNDRAVEFTVMATPEDLQANAEYIRMADQYIEVPGGSNNNNYANVDLIVDVAERAGVHAVWAGWGHASENPRLPEALAASPHRPVFIGPPASAMRALGDKISSTIVAQSAQVPTLPWSGASIDQTVVDEQGHISVPEDAYRDACVHHAAHGLLISEKIGFPVMIKASEGGGGKGIRKVTCADEFALAYEQVVGEVPGSPIFVMKLAGESRHLEVQLLADQYGNAISLFGRDCSVQRRHQKIIEEAPVTIAPSETFRKMEQAAVRLGQLVGYVSAGTVEYLYDYTRDDFYFLELNPRLQVEHPTTEMVSGVNLPAAQLQVAMGIPLYRIRDIRLLYGLAPSGTSEIDFSFANEECAKLTLRRPEPKGHVIAVRITAENPEAGFKPSSGHVHELNFRSSTHVWGYFSVGTAGGGLHEYADSQFGHVFSWGENRELSRKNLVVALRQLSIRGDFRTTVEYLIRLLETDEFCDNLVNTAWLDMLITQQITADRPEPMLVVFAGAVSRALQNANAQINDFRRTLERGQCPPRDALRTDFSTELIYDGVKYRVTSTRSSLETFQIYLNGQRVEVSARELADGGLLVSLGGKSHTMYVKDDVLTARLVIDGRTCVLERENDPTQLRAPSPGKLVRFLVDSGAHVRGGQPYAEIEVMKMYMPLVATEDGTVQTIKQPGSVLEAGDLIAILTLDDPSRVKHAYPFEGRVPDFGTAHVRGEKLHQRFRHTLGILERALDGYDNQGVMSEALKQLDEMLHDSRLPYLEFYDVLAALIGRLPGKLESDLDAIFASTNNDRDVFPLRKLKEAVEGAVRNASASAADTRLVGNCALLLDVLAHYEGGVRGHRARTLIGLLEKYYDVESLFDVTGGDRSNDEEVILNLRDQHKDDLDTVIQIFLSHSKVSTKNKLVFHIFGLILPVTAGVVHGLGQLDKVFAPILKKIADLTGIRTSRIALRAREMLMQAQLPSYEERLRQMEHILRSSVTENVYGSGQEYRYPSGDVLKDLVVTNFNVFDVLQHFFYHDDQWLRLAALDVYARRAYHAYEIVDMLHHTDNDDRFAVEWRFRLPDSERSALSSSHPQTHGSLFERISRVDSLSDITSLASLGATGDIRRGIMSTFMSFEEVEASFQDVLDLLPSVVFASDKRMPSQKPLHVMNVAVRVPLDDDFADDRWVDRLGRFVQEQATWIREKLIRRVTFVLYRSGQTPGIFTFRESHQFKEDRTIRHIDPALTYQLELPRLSNFEIEPLFIDNRQLHIYYAVGKENPSDCRFFIRTLVRPGRLKSNVQTAEYLISESDRLVSDILDALEIVSSQRTNSDCNHLYINFIPTFVLEPEQVESALTGFIDRHGQRLWRLRVTGAEIRFTVNTSKFDQPIPIRFCVNNVSGFILKMEIYIEVKKENGHVILKSLGEPGSLHLQPVNTAYQTKEWLQPRRYKAHVMGTTYVYDFPDMFRQALRARWDRFMTCSEAKMPADIFTAKELAPDDEDILRQVDRAPGSNTCGMVAWIFTMKTPEYPDGRQIVVIANDITFQIGSFGVAEDQLFFKASEMARQLGLPRFYISANSGARIGLAEEVRSALRIQWADDAKPELGFDYVYVTEEDYQAMTSTALPSILAEKVLAPDGSVHYRITDIIGANDGLGVENLRGSGLIAGESSRAYEEIFTITLVSCRSVGIGAYLVRLGQRVIQNEGQPIILTGAAALNKVLGREVYASNLQLGGTQIMHRNGVSHLVSRNDFEGVSKMLSWLSFVPKSSKAPLPILPIIDPVDRAIDFMPPRGPYDPRDMLAGVVDAETNEWTSGFFDKDSFQETLAGWARTVITGRARLGGIPMGVIAVETRTVDNRIPADPANANSEEQTFQEAGMVWYPNSAHKTAQAINDFNLGERLPLIIFANWRGFSGGQRDMFNEILKYGAYIVDALRKYEQPAFIYITPNGELRGGAWVVLDPTINSDHMEMYADSTSRAGVLEPEGIVEIKFRRPQLLALMAKLDPLYGELKAKLEDATLPIEQRVQVKDQFDRREQLLMPVYQQVAVAFADLHDTPGRMHAKGAIRKVLEWKSSRSYFYWRLRRRLAELALAREVMAADPECSITSATALVSKWVLEDADVEDRTAVEAMETSKAALSENIERIRVTLMQKHMRDFITKDSQAALEAILSALNTLSDEEKSKFSQRLVQICEQK